MKKNKRKKGKIKIILLIAIILLSLSAISIITYAIYYNYKEQKALEDNLRHIQKIQDSYHNYVLTTKETNLYNENNETLGMVSENMYLELEELEDNHSSEYFQIKDSNLYIKYTDIIKTEKKNKDETRYKNYIPFNKSVITNKETKLYIDENTYYIINENINLPIIIDDTDKYYVVYNDSLVYVNKTEAEIIDSQNTTLETAQKISILNYHFVINVESGENKLCEPSSICHTDTQFDSHMKYIADNNFYSITMKELEMFIDGKINLPKKSVAITIDDGWFVSRAITILEKYDVMGTLFLIGYLAPVSDYASSNLEVHSHTWNLHNISNCSGGRSPLLCYDTNKLLEDLKKSRESLNNTTYFCYPFYDYNNHAINALKEAGFTMALTGGNKSATKGIDKFKVPRYVVYNTTTTNSLAKMINN